MSFTIIINKLSPTSDRNRNQLNVEKRLCHRALNGGLTVNAITPPDFETQWPFLLTKIMDYDYHFLWNNWYLASPIWFKYLRDLEGLKDISLVANVRQLDTITVEVLLRSYSCTHEMDGPKLTLIPIEDIKLR